MVVKFISFYRYSGDTTNAKKHKFFVVKKSKFEGDFHSVYVSRNAEVESFKRVFFLEFRGNLSKRCDFFPQCICILLCENLIVVKEPHNVAYFVALPISALSLFNFYLASNWDVFNYYFQLFENTIPTQLYVFLQKVSTGRFTLFIVP